MEYYRRDLADVTFVTYLSRELFRYANERERMLLVFIERPKTVTDDRSGQAWLDGFLLGCGVPRDKRVAVYHVPPQKDMGAAVGRFIKRYEEFIESPLSIKGVTTLAGLNVVGEDCDVRA